MSDERNYETQNSEFEDNTQQTNYGEPVQYNNTQHYDDPYQNAPAEEPGGFAIASLVLGILSLVLSCFYINVVTGIISIILGAVHLAKRRTRRGMAIAGIICSIISIVLLVIIVAIGLAFISSNADLYQQYQQILK